MLTPEEQQAIRERVNKAMPEPWEWSQERMGVLLGGHDELGWLKVLTVLAFDIDPDDAAFIAHAREDVPKLLDEVERLQRAVQIPEPKTFIDGNKWCALYGNNLQSGVAGFGDSIDGAYADFVKNWIHEALAGETT